MFLKTVIKFLNKREREREELFGEEEEENNPGINISNLSTQSAAEAKKRDRLR